MIFTFTSKKGILTLKYYKTLCVIIGSVVMGHNFGIMGPTLVHLEYVFNTDTQGMALAYTGGNLGGFIGAIVCGVFFDKYDWDHQFFQSFLGMGVATFVAPWMPNAYLYSLAMAIGQFLMSYISTGMTPYLISLWSSSRYNNAMFQIRDTAWSTGAFTIPLITLPFLAKLPRKRFHLKPKIPEEEIVLNDAVDLQKGDMTQLLIPAEIYNVRYPYVIVGITAAFVAILFGLVINTSTVHNTDFKSTLDQDHSKSKKQGTTSSEQKLKLMLKLLVSVFACFVVWQGTILGTFLSVFVIKGLGWSVKKGPLITSLFRGTQGLGRLLGIVTSIYLSPSQVLAINMAIGITAYCTLISAITVFNSSSLVWLSTIMAGLSVSNSFPTAVLWGAQYLKAKASYSSLFGISLSVGTMTSASLAGYLFQNYSPVSILYLLIFASLLNMFIFSVMQLVSKTYVNTIQKI